MHCSSCAITTAIKSNTGKWQIYKDLTISCGGDIDLERERAGLQIGDRLQDGERSLAGDIGLLLGDPPLIGRFDRHLSQCQHQLHQIF